IMREADGLALSSRNAYLSADERVAAATLPKALALAAQAIRAGDDVAQALEQARTKLAQAGFGPIDYLELADEETLAPLSANAPRARLFAAAYLGRTRLIDNLEV
ncbi:MAG: pantoate--beta-alanine ligase, partial [Alphaproteobacteria bacterium]|nr:pantoate--beta-alanine ligase [Alphaproteobacteria bacterium]